MKNSILKCGLGLNVICVFALTASMPVKAQGVAGVTDKEILIGSCSALEGPSKFLGTQTVIGANAYFKVINAEGGVHRRHLKLISSDDSYRSEEHTSELQ